MTELDGSASWQPLVHSSTASEAAAVLGQCPQKAPCSNALPSKREIFMSTLLTRVPIYALQLLAEGNESKLSCLARLSRDDLAAILAQPHPQLLLEAVYTKQQQMQLAQCAFATSNNNSSDLGDLEDSPFIRSLQHLKQASIRLNEDDLLPQPACAHSSSGCSGAVHLLSCSSNIISSANSPVCSPLAAVAAAQSWPYAGSTSSNTRRYRFRGTPVCANCGFMGHTADACFTPHCSTCQLWGHSVSDCPSAQCWICGCFGHSFADCPEQQPQLSLMSSVLSQPGSSVLLSCTSSRAISTLNSCGSSSVAILAASASTSTSSGACEPADGSSSRGGNSNDCEEARYPDTLPASSPVEESGAAGGGSKPAVAPVTPPAVAAAPLPTPAKSTAAASSSSTKPRKYMFGGHGRGPLVCCKCGAMGHVADKCRTPHCSQCRRYGHNSSACDSACSKCGKEHDGPRCTHCTARCCVNCGLWGHRPRNCPAAQCSNCGYYGHLAAQCMACPQCKKHGHTATKCPVTKLLGVDMYELIINDSV